MCRHSLFVHVPFAFMAMPGSVCTFLVMVLCLKVSENMADFIFQGYAHQHLGEKQLTLSLN